MRKFLLVLVWIPITISSLVVSLVLLNFYSQVQKVKNGSTLLSLQAKQMYLKNGYQFYASLPEVLGTFSTAVAASDARAEIIRQFLNRYDAPLGDYADKIVTESDKQNIDFRLITAISFCESNGGKRMPEGSYNAFGYAIYTGQDHGVIFDNWDHAIETMAKYLADKYYSQGLTTPEEIGPLYAPPSVNTGNSWAKCVRSFMDELR